MIIKGKHTDYTYYGGDVIIITTDMGYAARQGVMYLSKDSSNHLSVLSIVCRMEKQYA